MGMDSGMRNITVKITVEAFRIIISDLYQISYFIMHLHKCAVSACTKTPISLQRELELL